METQKIVILGCGNVASYFAQKFKQLNHSIVQIYHPNIIKAQAFARPYEAQFIDCLTDLNQEADLYFIAVKDSAIANISNQITINKGIVVHTSGAIKLAILNAHQRSAVFYPLQTFTKGIKTLHQDFPMFIECLQKNDENYLTNLALSMGNKVYYMNSDQRTEIHLAAVFAANFSNHCIKIAYDLMQLKKHEAEMLLPLIKEGINKLNFIEPSKAQTGPAIRRDETTIEKHLSMLNDDESLKKIYDLLSKNIQTSN